MIALELGPAKVGEERLLTRGELVGLAAQRAQLIWMRTCSVGGGCRPAAWSEATSIDATIAAASASAQAQDIAHNRAIKGRNRRIVNSSFVIRRSSARITIQPCARGHRLRGRRVGLAVSDASRTLARPLETLTRPHGSSDAHGSRRGARCGGETGA